MEMELKAIQISTLQLGDHVNFGCDPFGWGTVTAVWDDAIEITRPYLHTSDFSSVASRSGETTGSRLTHQPSLRPSGRILHHAT